MLSQMLSRGATIISSNYKKQIKGCSGVIGSPATASMHESSTLPATAEKGQEQMDATVRTMRCSRRAYIRIINNCIYLFRRWKGVFTDSRQRTNKGDSCCAESKQPLCTRAAGGTLASTRQQKNRTLKKIHFGR